MDRSRMTQAMLDVPAACDACASMDALASFAARTVAAAGMSCVSSCMLSGPAAGDGGRHFQRPAGWLRACTEGGGGDPLLGWALISGAPARFSSILAQLPPRHEGRQIARLLAECGLLDGVVTPVRTLAGHIGVVLVAGPAPRVGDPAFHFLHFTSAAILRRAEVLHAGPARPPAPCLTRRERECVALLVQGSTESEIAARLGIGEVTARFHLDNARHKTGARSRIHLAGIAGLWMGRPAADATVPNPPARMRRAVQPVAAGQIR